MSKSTDWIKKNIPELKGRRFFITGGNSGLGFQTAKHLLMKKASVIIGCRNKEKGQDAIDRLKKILPDADVSIVEIDLMERKSIMNAAYYLIEEYRHIDGLINNAGIMSSPEKYTTDGIDSQMQSNYYGHVLLTYLLLPLLNKSKNGRIVFYGSLAAINAELDYNKIPVYKPYETSRVYGMTKLMCIMFALELNKRLEKSSFNTRAFAVHPGGAKTNLQKHLPRSLQLLGKLIMQDSDMGALPALYAAASNLLSKGQYYGPSRFGEFSGYPKPARLPKNNMDANSLKSLFEHTEHLLNIEYNL